MELFGARPDSPDRESLKEVRESNVFVLIVGHLYGTYVPDGDESFVEAEYREARAARIPCLVYLRDDETPVAPRFVETDSQKREKLTAFKDHLRRSHVVANFSSSRDLAKQLRRDIGKFLLSDEDAPSRRWQTTVRAALPSCVVLLVSYVLVAIASSFVEPFQEDRGGWETGPRRAVGHLLFDGVVDPQKGLDVWTALIVFVRGFAANAELLSLVLFTGLAIAALSSCGVPGTLAQLVPQKVRQRPFVIIVIALLYATATASFGGMSEELLLFMLLLESLCVAFGMSPGLSVAAVLTGCAIGWTTAIANPYVIRITEEILGVNMASNLIPRACLAGGFLLLALRHLYAYHTKTQRDVENGLDAGLEPDLVVETPATGNRTKRVILAGLTALTLVIMTVGSLNYAKDYPLWTDAVSVLLTLLTVVVLAVGRPGISRFAKHLGYIAPRFFVCALLLGCATSIALIFKETKIFDPIIEASVNVISGIEGYLAAVCIAPIAFLCAFMVPSSWGQAVTLMPFAAPTADLAGIERETTALAFMLGSGLAQLVLPTQTLLIVLLATGRVRYGRWLKFILPLFAKMALLGLTVVALLVKL